ncbi:MAG: hypothetical protein ACKOWI_07165 [Rhodoluna sp.]
MYPTIFLGSGNNGGDFICEALLFNSKLLSKFRVGTRTVENSGAFTPNLGKFSGLSSAGNALEAGKELILAVAASYRFV